MKVVNGGLQVCGRSCQPCLQSSAKLVNFADRDVSGSVPRPGLGGQPSPLTPGEPTQKRAPAADRADARPNWTKTNTCCSRMTIASWQLHILDSTWSLCMLFFYFTLVTVRANTGQYTCISQDKGVCGGSRPARWSGSSHRRHLGGLPCANGRSGS